MRGRPRSAYVGRTRRRRVPRRPQNDRRVARSRGAANWIIRRVGQRWTGGNVMKSLRQLAVFGIVALLGVAAAAHAPRSADAVSERAYFPPRGQWESRKPADVGMNEAALAD